MKKLLPVLLSFTFFAANAQVVGVNTNNPQASLDIRAGNPALPANTDGLLIPRIDAFPLTNPTALQNGMMVYLTNDIGLNLKGFYSWDNAGTTWKAIASPPSTNNWGLSGNAGTNSATNFIGTTDNQDLVFKRGAILSGRINDSNTSLGYLSLLSNNTGFQNTALGLSAMRFNTTGYQNTALGTFALRQNFTGFGNVAVGYESLLNNDAGNNNIGIGYQTLQINTTGSRNYAIGYRALESIQSGNNNIGIGSFADVTDPNGNNQMSIGNVIYGKFMHSAGGLIGIGVSNPTEKLEVAGKTKTADLQVTNGAGAGKVLTSDGTGNAIWQTPTTPQNWGQTGNIGTNANINFIGTIDDVDLVFKRNNVQSGRIGATNASFGTEALLSNTGFGNVALGSQSLYSNTTGVGNVASGFQSLFLNTTGFYNVASGFTSLYSNTTGFGNVALGNQSLRFNTTGSNNAASGNQSLYSNTTGGNNVASGSESLYSNTTGFGNVASGLQSLYFNTIGINNVASGSQSLYSNTTGYNNVASGNQSLFSNTIGFGNVASGNQSLYNNSTGNYNIASGNQSLYANTTGSNNVASGYRSLYANTTGGLNTAVGLNSLKTNQDGSLNTAIGANALSADNGNWNTAIGSFAMPVSTGSFRNVGVGYGTLFSMATGNDNVAVGPASLYSFTTGTNNVVIGSNAAIDLISGNRNIAIGANTNFLNNTGNNQLNIGNQIFGTGLSGTLIAPVGNIGIGTASPTNTFEIKSTTANTSGLTFTNLISTSPTNTGTAIGVNATGQVITIPDGSLNNWSKTGNASTIAGTNFIGTTDDIDLVFKRNNLTAGRITTDNLSFGVDALIANTIGVANTAFGTSALKANNLGFNNTAVGTQALADNATATAIRNTAIGAFAMRLNSTGQNNTALGSSALTSNTTGIANTAIGQHTLFFNAIGSQNTVIGAEAMGVGTNTGNQNVAVGNNTLSRNTSGSFNSAVGFNAMGTGINTGANNVAFGSFTLFNNTAGNNNTAIGTNALNLNTTGSSNNAIGFALYANTSGSNNNALGSRALISNTIGNTNTGIGHWALEFTTTGSNNSALGHRAGQLNTTGSNNLTLGFDAQVPTNTGSNQLSIANVIYATGTGTAGAGNVGIGTGAPTTKLDVAGTTRTTNFQMPTGASNNFILRSDGSGNANWANINTLETDPKVGGQTTYQVPKWNGSQLINGTITDLDNGWIGIGTTNPQAKLHVSGINYATSPSDQRGYFSNNTGTAIIQNVSSSGNILLRTDGWIWANGGGFVATSDARIKNIKGITNNQKDLAVLEKIEITDYKYKDEISNGSTLQKKVIAQQLKSVYPIAVNQSTGVIPNVFEVAKSAKVIANITEITTNKPHDFATGDEVKLILDKSGEKTFKVTVLSPTAFSISETITETIFVYGKKVNDLLNVDYDALTTLNISATQELVKEIVLLRAKNNMLITENEKNNRKIEAMMNDIKNIKTQLNPNTLKVKQ
jgi:trimeric autotransporter adhesin